MARYIVELCKFSDGTWYTKTETDSAGAAGSVANLHFGRIGRVIDTETGNVKIYDHNVDWDRYKENGVDIDSLF